MERIEFITHKGRQVLLLDFSNCTPQEVTMLATAVRSVVGRQEKKSVLILADFTRAQFNKDAITRIKEVATFDAPYVLRAAWVGAESMPETQFKSIQTFTTREFVQFKSREEALDWLVKA